MTTCGFFLRGACTYGTSCRNSHEISSSNRRAPKAPPLNASQRSAPCKFYLEGRCANGSKCTFSHAQTAGSLLPAASTASVFGPCKFFLEGRCTNGGACAFGHPHSETTPSTYLPLHQQAVEVATSTCIYFAQGSCKKGTSCIFRHPEPSTESQQDKQKSPLFLSAPCKFFARGTCANGDKCRFLHIVKSNELGAAHHITMETEKPAELPSDRAQDHKIPPKQQQPTDEQFSAPSSTTRSILNCEVDFGAGASIQQIITPFESSQIILSNLLQSVTKADLASLVDRLVGLVEFTIFESTGIARIRFENCDQAARAVQHLDGRMYRSVKLAARLDLRVAIESGSGILLSRKLKLSWFMPSRIAWAHYSNIQKAKEEAQRLDGKTFNGHKLAVSFQATATSTRYRVTRISSSIEIKGLPLRINEDHLRRFTRSSSIAIGDPSYSQEEASEKIRALLSEFGSLDSFDLLPSDSKKPKAAAFAQFSSSESAADAAKALNNMPQEFLRYSRLWAEQIHCIKYNISPRQFTTLKEELDRLRAVHGMIAKLRHYDRDEHGAPVSPVCIRIYGSDPKALGRLKGEVEALLLGETLMLADGSNLWDDYFETEDGRRFIDALNADLTCFVKCDTRTRAIRLSGNNDARERLKVSLVRQLDAVKAKRHVLSLGQEKLRALLTGGLKLLETEMGAEKVVLDVVARTITVRGDEDDVGKVCRTIAAMDSASPAVRAQTASSTQALCPVCFCDVFDPIKLPCGHSYCSTCMLHLLRARTGLSFSLLTCVAQKPDTERESAATSCSVYIPYPIIRQLLQPAEESALLRAAFHSHLRARPGEFRYCPTPDCPVIYRHRGEDEESGRVLQCPACIARICARCQVEFHEGLTCAEHIDNQSGGMQALQKWKEENGVKPCPECGVDLEKADGCNHIICIRCKTHMCWECMATFGTSGTHIYDHMNRAHGGIGITFDD